MTLERRSFNLHRAKFYSCASPFIIQNVWNLLVRVTQHVEVWVLYTNGPYALTVYLIVLVFKYVCKSNQPSLRVY